MSKPFQQATDDGAGSIFKTFSMKFPCLPKRFLLLVFGKENMRCIETYILLFWKKEERTDQWQIILSLVYSRAAASTCREFCWPPRLGLQCLREQSKHLSWGRAQITINAHWSWLLFFNKSYITVNVFALQCFCKLQWQIACSID